MDNIKIHTQRLPIHECIEEYLVEHRTALARKQYLRQRRAQAMLLAGANTSQTIVMEPVDPSKVFDPSVVSDDQSLFTDLAASSRILHSPTYKLFPGWDSVSKTLVAYHNWNCTLERRKNSGTTIEDLPFRLRGWNIYLPTLEEMLTCMADGDNSKCTYPSVELAQVDPGFVPRQMEQSGEFPDFPLDAIAARWAQDDKGTPADPDLVPKTTTDHRDALTPKIGQVTQRVFDSGHRIATGGSNGGVTRQCMSETKNNRRLAGETANLQDEDVVGYRIRILVSATSITSLCCFFSVLAIKVLNANCSIISLSFVHLYHYSFISFLLFCFEVGSSTT